MSDKHEAPEKPARPLTPRPPVIQRGPVFIPRHDDPPELLPDKSWDRRVRAGIIGALTLALVLGGITFRPAIERAFTWRQADAAPRSPVVSPFSVEAVARASLELDASTHAIRAFRERRTDYLARRIDCAALASGYAAADSAVLTAAVVLKASSDSLNAATVSRYTAILASMDTVNAFFDGTGCGRP